MADSAPKSDIVFKFVNVRAPRKSSQPAGKGKGKGVAKDVIVPSGDEKSQFQDELRKQAAGSPGKAVELAGRFIQRSDRYVRPGNPQAQELIEIAASGAEGDVPGDLATRLWDSYYAQALNPWESPQDREFIADGIRAAAYLQARRDMTSAESPEWERYRRAAIAVPADLVPKASPSPQSSGISRAKRLEKVQSLVRETEEALAAAAEIEGGHQVFRARRGTEAIKQAVLNPQAALKAKAAPVATREGIGAESFHLPPKPSSWLYTAFAKEVLKPSSMKVLQTHQAALAALPPPEAAKRLFVQAQAKAAQFIHGELSTEERAELLDEPEYRKLLYVTKLADVNGSLTKGAKGRRKPYPKGKMPDPSPESRGIRPLGIGDLFVVKEELLRYVAGEVAHIENVMATEERERVHRRVQENEEIVITETEKTEEDERSLQTTSRFELQKEAQSTIEQELKVGAGVEVSGSYGPVQVTASADFGYSLSSSQSERTASGYAKEVTEKSIAKIYKKAREERTRRVLERIEEQNKHGFLNRGEAPRNINGIYRWVDKYYRARLINYGKRLMIEFIVPEPASFYLQQTTGQPPQVAAVKPEAPRIQVMGQNGEWTDAPLRPHDISDTEPYWEDGRELSPGYLYWASLYGAEVSPPPPYQVLVGKSYAEAVKDGAGGIFAKASSDFAIPDGYVAWDLYGTGIVYGTDGKRRIQVDVAGVSWWSFDHGKGINDSNVDIGDVEKVIPVSLHGDCMSYSLNFYAVCTRKPEAYVKWQEDTYNAIMRAYEHRLAEYNEAVAAAAIQAGVRIQGRNPEINRRLERDELRRGCIHLLTDGFRSLVVDGVALHDFSFEAVKQGRDASPLDYEEPSPGRALLEGKVTQWFEQAFDWNNMTYRFYPYFWGRKWQWPENYGKLDETDPKFSDFLRAGAARVVVPARPEYTEAVLYYLGTNILWNGGDVPTLNDPLYVDITKEIKEDADADAVGELPACDLDSGYPCQVEEWEVKIPTTLVYLQESQELPEFTSPTTSP